MRAVRALSGFPPPRLRRPLLGLAACVFLIGSVVAVDRLHLAWSDVGWRWIVLASALGVPLTIVGKTVEFQLSGRIIGAEFDFPTALRVSVLSTAANLLPIPGSVLVRIQALRQAGNRYSRATFATAVMGFAWVGVAATAAGGFLIAFGLLITGLGWGLTGLALLGVTFSLANTRLRSGTRIRFTAMVIGVETLQVCVGALRLYLVLLALGEPASLTAASLLTLASVLASAAGVFPGGLGLRELLATILIPLAGMAAAAGFLASAVDRIVGLAVHAPLAAAYALRREHRRSEPPADCDALPPPR